jgi:hypothetical protein
MFEQLNFEAEPFAFEADSGSEWLDGRAARGRRPAEREFETPTAASAPQCVTALLKTPKPPKGLILLPHFHVRKTLPKGNASGVVECMEPAGMNPGFVTNDELVTSPSATGLHARLKALMESKQKQRPQKMNVQRVSVALVDLTGPRLFAPDFAGWRSTVPMYGASLSKICALYAVHQLCSELRSFANHFKLATKQALIAHLRGLWDKAGVSRKQQPNLDYLFAYTETPPKPVAVEPSAKLQELISCTYSGNCNWAASLLIDRVGLAYIGSVLWQSGLFHPKRGGLWLKKLYASRCDSSCTSYCCFPGHQIEKALQPVYVTPSSGSHCATALSAATYFTLMAQGRLADDGTSNRIRNDLKSACSMFGRYQLECSKLPVPTKCGVWGGYYHDVALVERSTAPGCTGKVIRYAVALLTHHAFPSGDVGPIFQQFLSEADALIQQNNP